MSVRATLIWSAMFGALAACSNNVAAPPSTGSLEVVINAPPGTAPRVHVYHLPDANGYVPYERWLSSSQTFDGIPLGSYVVHADDIDTTSAYYLGVPDQQTAFVRGGETTTATCDFVLDSRQVQILVSGLPPGEHGRVYLGESGSPLPDTITLRFLPGIYAFTAGPVIVSGVGTYDASPASWSDTVVASPVMEVRNVVYQLAP